MFSQPKTSIQKHEKRWKIRIDVTHNQFTQINFQALDIESLSHQKKDKKLIWEFSMRK